MHDILSSRLARLTSAAASPEAKTFLKSEETVQLPGVMRHAERAVKARMAK